MNEGLIGVATRLISYTPACRRLFFTSYCSSKMNQSTMGTGEKSSEKDPKADKVICVAKPAAVSATSAFEPKTKHKIACKHCLEQPCILRSFLKPRLDQIGEHYHDAGASNKEIRYELYHQASSFLHGRLGKGVRRILPQCVEGYIKNKYPNAAGQQYVGYKDGTQDTHSVSSASGYESDY